MNIINELNNIKLDDLAKIDYLKLAQQLRRRPDVIASIVAVLLTLFVVAHSFIQTQKKLTLLRSQRLALQQKAEEIKKYDQAKKDLADFLANIPPHITDTQFVGFVTETANRNQIPLVSLSPRKGPANEYYDSFQIDLTISTRDYETMLRFLYALEHSKFAIRIDSWSGGLKSTGSRPARQSDTAVDGQVEARITLTALNIKK